MTEHTPPTSSPDAAPRRPRARLWWTGAAAAVVALVAAAFVVVPRVTGGGPTAAAATNSWQNACADKLSGGSITPNQKDGVKGFTLSCLAGMEAYVGKSPGGNTTFALVPRDGAACILLRMDPVFISNPELEGVADVYWNPYRGWDPKPENAIPGQPSDPLGQEGARLGDPGGYGNGRTIGPAAGVLQGKRADGSVAWERQYGSNVQIAGNTPGRCKAGVR